MPESQNVEWKESWRDEYLKWICGFANAQGGRIYIGKNDKGEIVGVKDYSKLMEDIPNKVQMSLGIKVDVNLMSDFGLFYIEINVPPSNCAVNYKGEYHYRCGSTKQQLKGAALTDFLLSKTGRQLRWDALPEPDYKIEDLDYESFKIFRNAARQSGRIKETDLNINNQELLQRMGLMTNGVLKRAAVLLFYRHPEQVISGCFIKIGKFGKGADLIHHEEIRGSLFEMADRVIDILCLKYLTASISYIDNIRVERYPYPMDALRELIYNALIHCDWSAGEPIQIKVTDDKLSISNVCVLPPGWTQESLLTEHKSKPYNPDIAFAFFRAGWVEIWGRGIVKVEEACEDYGIPKPSYEIKGEDLTVTLYAASKSGKISATVNHVLCGKGDKSTKIESLILEEIAQHPHITQIKLAEKLRVTRRVVQAHMKNLTDKGLIAREGTKRNSSWIIK